MQTAILTVAQTLYGVRAGAMKFRRPDRLSLVESFAKHPNLPLHLTMNGTVIEDVSLTKR